MVGYNFGCVGACLSLGTRAHSVFRNPSHISYETALARRIVVLRRLGGEDFTAIHSRTKRSDSDGMARLSFLITAHALALTHNYFQPLIPYDLVKSSDSVYLCLSTIMAHRSCWTLVLVGLTPHILRWEMV